MKCKMITGIPVKMSGRQAPSQAALKMQNRYRKHRPHGYLPGAGAEREVAQTAPRPMREVTQRARATREVVLKSSEVLPAGDGDPWAELPGRRAGDLDAGSFSRANGGKLSFVPGKTVRQRRTDTSLKPHVLPSGIPELCSTSIIVQAPSKEEV